MLTWDRVEERYYEHGLDRGVLYLSGQVPVPWNGLTGLEEGGSGESSLLYRDGVIYMADVEASDFTARVTALFFPDEFHECLGMPEVVPGLYVDNQKPKRFDMSYRTLIGSGAKGDEFGHQIHLIYKAMATIGTRSRKTLGPDTTPVELTFDLSCTPVKLTGYRPTAHYIIDTRNMSSERVIAMEKILYGHIDPNLDIITEPIEDPTPGYIPGRMPLPNELRALITEPL